MSIHVGLNMLVELGTGQVLIQYGIDQKKKAAMVFHQVDEAMEPGAIPPDEYKSEKPSQAPLCLRFTDEGAITRLIDQLTHMRELLNKAKQVEP